MIPRQAIPSLWTDRLTADGMVALGLDVATTEKGTSNPSALSVQQREGRRVYTRLLVSFKTSDPAVSRQVISSVLDDLEGMRIKPRRLVADNSNEKFFSADLRRLFGSRVAVELVAGNNKLEFRGETLDAKTLLGNMYVAAIEDCLLTLPAGDWIILDHRLVMREAGGFATNLGPNGEHGDTFDAGKLAYWGLNSNSGPVRADAIQVGTGMGGTGNPERAGLGPRLNAAVRTQPKPQGILA